MTDNKDIFSVFNEMNWTQEFSIPVGCKLVHSHEEGGEVVSYSFVTRYGVINEYEKNENGGWNIVSVMFPDGYTIDVDRLLEED